MTIQIISELNLEQVPPGELYKYWVHIVSNGLSQPVQVPLMLIKGHKPGPVLGLTSTLHGNELNGIPIIQTVFKAIDPPNINGTLIGVPGSNPLSIMLDQRQFIDNQDLNRNFPGRLTGNRSQQYVKRIFDKIVRHFNFHVDMHTASFGRVNSFYIKADLQQETLLQMALLQEADIILQNQEPSFGPVATETQTLRQEASQHNIASITIEYGNPQIYQPQMLTRGSKGILNLMRWLKMIDGPLSTPPQKALVCQKSYWIYTDEGGLLDIPVALKEHLKKGDLIGILKNPFGDLIKTYYAPEDGIVIGKSTNPVNMHGGRIIHLGILK